MSFVTHLACLSCGRSVESEPFRYRCPDCGGFLEVEYDYEAMARAVSRESLDRRRGAILRQWLPLLPIEDAETIDRVTLGERPTPMIRAHRLRNGSGREELWLKDESRFPTCSLKDRSVPITIVKALEHGRDSVGIVSSGNASASLAAYAARAGLTAVVFVREGAAPSKLYKTLVYRPVAIQVQGSLSAAEALFEQARDEFGFFDCDGLINPYRIEGKKTLAFEVARDLGWRAPAAVLMPTGYGNGIVAAWKGFRELHRLGLIDSLPALYAVQPAVCAPIARAFERGDAVVEPVPSVVSIAEAVCTPDPQLGGQRVLQAVRESRGAALAVDEDEIIQAVRLLAEFEGLAIEPTGAVALAGWLKLTRDGNPWQGQPQVVSITGHGLNAAEAGARIAGEPLQVEPDYEAVHQALKATGLKPVL
jgi:threonine synthase